MNNQFVWFSASWVCILLLCFARQAELSQAQSVTIHAEHPRIFVNKQSLQRIANQCDKGGPMEPSYQSLLRWVDSNPLKANNAYFPRSYCDARFGFLYLIEKELGRDVSRFVRHFKDACWKADGTCSGVMPSFRY